MAVDIATPSASLKSLSDDSMRTIRIRDLECRSEQTHLELNEIRKGFGLPSRYHEGVGHKGPDRI